MLLRRLFSPRTLEFRDGCLAGAVHLATVAAHTFVADATAETLSTDEAKEKLVGVANRLVSRGRPLVGWPYGLLYRATYVSSERPRRPWPAHLST